MNPDRLAAHLSVNSYGSFTLTDAVRPGAGLPVRRAKGIGSRCSGTGTPGCGSRCSPRRCPRSASSTRFWRPRTAGDVVHVVLESSHGIAAHGHTDLRRSDIDLPVLASHFCEFEELLTHDGCTGVAVMADRVPMEVQFDEHKLFHVYAPDLKPFRRVLRAHGGEAPQALAADLRGRTPAPHHRRLRGRVPATRPPRRCRRLRSRVQRRRVMEEEY